MGLPFHGDTTTLSAARREARQRFKEGRKLAAAEAVEGIEEAILPTNFVDVGLWWHFTTEFEVESRNLRRSSIDLWWDDKSGFDCG